MITLKPKPLPTLAPVGRYALIFLIIVLGLSLHRYFTFYTTNDQGIFNQVFWNNLHGHFFQSSLSSQLSTNVIHDGEVPTVYYHRLGQHFTPALLLWLPLYALWPSPAMLLVLQVGLATAAGLVLYVLARQRLSPQLATWIAASYYGANAVIGPALGNFYDACQLPLFVFGLLLGLEKRWYWLFWLGAILTLAIREDAGVVLVGIGAYLVLSKRDPGRGGLLVGLSIGYILLITGVVMPIFSADISRRFMIERFGQYVTTDDASTLAIIAAIARQPWQLFVELVTPVGATLGYLLGHGLPLAFVPAIAPASWVISGLPLLQILLQQGTEALSINVRYATPVIPGLFYGAILWWSQRLAPSAATAIAGATGPSLPSRRLRRFWAGCIALSLLFTLTANPHRAWYFLMPDSLQPWVYVSLPRQWHHVSQIHQVLAQIPPTASVSASRFLVPQVSGRRAVLQLPYLQVRDDQFQVINMEYAIADFWNLSYQLAFAGARAKLAETLTVFEQAQEQGGYAVVAYADGVVLLQWQGVPKPTAIAAWEAQRRELRSRLAQWLPEAPD
ncbi:DUF2079 domain-containing protein [Trichothermofontia sp.]